MRGFAASLASDGELADIARLLGDAVETLEQTAEWMVADGRDGADAAAGSVPFLRMFGIVTGGYLLARQAAAAASIPNGYDPAFLRAKIASARFFAAQIVPQAIAMAGPSTGGRATLYALSDDEFAPAA
jgi:hypothetical protein